MFKKIGHWIITRLGRVPARDHYVSAWFILAFLLATTAAAIVVAIGNPTGAGMGAYMLDIGKAIGINLLVFLVWIFLSGALLSLLHVPLPRLFLSSFIYTMIASIYILKEASSGTFFSYMMGISYSIIALLLGFVLLLLFHKRVNKWLKISLCLVIVVFGILFINIGNFDEDDYPLPPLADYQTPLEIDSPAMPGSYDYSFFTYGSGDDLHRPWFGKEIDEETPTVDASHFITSWRKSRENFWGFGPEQLPVNGRVFMPEGDGPFPVILMVHGNHTMEYFSTSGYDYLGELLASRGFITISVDEDFINYSNTYGIPNNNYELRAWMFLQHLAHLQDMNADTNSHLYQKIDFEQVALVGHSRGGQAAPMAADYETFFPEDPVIDKMTDVNVKAVVAIAPTDKDIDGKKPNLYNTSYLLLHGARDADLYNFRGDQQFYRTTFAPSYNGFKASIYIGHANHTQFNTDWGRTDLSLPRGLFLSHKQTMAPADQQQVAKGYMAAFFESVFHADDTYEQVLQDYRYGNDWLPNTMYINKYQHASYEPIIAFNTEDDVPIDATGFTHTETLTPKDRNDSQRPVDALQLEWDDEATYTTTVPNGAFTARQHLVLTMANIGGDLTADDVPHIEVELETSDGVTVQRPLADFMTVPPVVKSDFTTFGLLDHMFRDGKYEKSWEPIFQTFNIPLELFETDDPAFTKEQITKIKLHFADHAGAILLEEIGVW